MAPGRRHRSDRDLPLHLEVERKGGVAYYRYRHPRTGKSTGLGTNRAHAIQIAKLCNSRLLDEEAALAVVARVTGDADTVSVWVKKFVTETLPTLRGRRGQPLARLTVSEYRRQLQDFAAAYPDVPIATVTRRQIAEHLAGYPAVSSNRRRAVLSLLFQHAIAQGLTEDNPVAKTLARPTEVKRQSLSWEGYLAVREHAEPWMQRAMDLALLTLQRREDLVDMRWPENGVIRVRQKKTGACIELVVAGPLAELIGVCRDAVASPFILHRRPQMLRADHRKIKAHWTQLMPGMLSRGFHAARETSGFYRKLAPEARPTFHEIRGLGGDRYRKAGWTEAQIQRLMGHTTPRMTRGYLEGHEHWERVTPFGVSPQGIPNDSRKNPESA